MYLITSRSIDIPPECPWSARKWAKKFWESSQYSDLVLLLPSWKSRSQCFSEESRVPCFANAFSSTGLVVSQWSAASDCRSSWSWWRTILVTILEAATDRALPYEELAGITFHFLSVVGMVLGVEKDAWLGEILRVSAQVSLMLVWLETWAAPVSWMLVFDCPKQDYPSAFWSSVSNSAPDLCFGIGNMDVIHEPTLSSGNQNMGCPLSIIGWWNCNFKSILVKMFHDLNFNGWSKKCSSRKCCKVSGLWVYSRKGVFST